MGPTVTDHHLSAFSALQDFRAALCQRDHALSAITASAVVSYANRHTAVADLEIERALRNLPGARRLFGFALVKIARASSWSVAAAADRVTERNVGAWRLEIIDESDGCPWLVIHSPPDVAPVVLLELRRPDGAGCRLDLGQAIDSIFQLRLDPGFEDLADIADWLQDPLTEIHLL